MCGQWGTTDGTIASSWTVSCPHLPNACQDSCVIHKAGDAIAASKTVTHSPTADLSVVLCWYPKLFQGCCKGHHYFPDCYTLHQARPLSGTIASSKTVTHSLKHDLCVGLQSYQKAVAQSRWCQPAWLWYCSPLMCVGDESSGGPNLQCQLVYLAAGCHWMDSDWFTVLAWWLLDWQWCLRRVASDWLVPLLVWLVSLNKDWGYLWLQDQCILG